MTFTFYNNTAENSRVDKTNYLTNAFTITSDRVQNNQSVLTPVVSVSFASTPSYNYVRVEELNRYYFITNITWIGSNIYELSLQCDVLMSYKDAIYATTAFVNRAQNANSYICDDRVIMNLPFAARKIQLSFDGGELTTDGNKLQAVVQYTTFKET